MKIEGFSVRVSPALTTAALSKQALDVIRASLSAVRKEVPSSALKVLTQSPIWLENNIFSLGRVSVFNADVGWLRRSGQPLQKVGGVQIANARQFSESWNKGYRVLIHELSHAYQWRLFPQQDDVIENAYHATIASGRYQRVAFCCGGADRRAAALDSPTEYFAELSSAYFERCEFFPFDRKELKEYDPEEFSVIEQIWGSGASKAR